MSAPSLDVLRASPPGDAGARSPGAGAAPATEAGGAGVPAEAGREAGGGVQAAPARATPAALLRGAGGRLSVPPRPDGGAVQAAGSARRARALLCAVCAHFGVDPQEWQVRRAGGQPLWALRYAAYLICSEVDLPGSRLAALLGKDRATLLYHRAVMAQLAPEPLHALRLASIRARWRAAEQSKEQGPHRQKEDVGG